MVLPCCWSCPSYPSSTALFSHSLSRFSYKTSLSMARKPSSHSQLTCFVKLGLEDFVEIAHNKVLIAAGVSAAIGQLSKPFTSLLLYRKDFDFKAAFQAGGFPSTHSSAVVATATTLALERGFSDSVVGLSVVYAGLIMYDAQGVRREVGNHAKVLNKLLSEKQVYSMASKDREDLVDSLKGNSSTPGDDLDPLLSKEGRRLVQNSTSSSLLLNSEKKTRQINQMLASPSVSAAEEETGNKPTISTPLKESIGHTEVEVIAGAILGFLVSLVVYAVV